MLCLRRPNNPFCRLCFAMLFFHPQIFFQLGLDFLAGLQRLFVIISTEHSCRSAGTILYIFRCMPANWRRTIFPALLIKNADLLIRFSRSIFRMGPTPAMRPACWPIPASCGAVPPGPPNPMWRAPVPSVPPGDEPSVGRDWHRRRSQTSGR